MKEIVGTSARRRSGRTSTCWSVLHRQQRRQPQRRRHMFIFAISGYPACSFVPSLDWRVLLACARRISQFAMPINRLLCSVHPPRGMERHENIPGSGETLIRTGAVHVQFLTTFVVLRHGSSSARRICRSRVALPGCCCCKAPGQAPRAARRAAATSWTDKQAVRLRRDGNACSDEEMTPM